MGDSVLSAIQQTIDRRKSADPSESYVAQLLHKGEDKILKKSLKKRAKY